MSFYLALGKDTALGMRERAPQVPSEPEIPVVSGDPVIGQMFTGAGALFPKVHVYCLRTYEKHVSSLI